MSEQSTAAPSGTLGGSATPRRGCGETSTRYAGGISLAAALGGTLLSIVGHRQAAVLAGASARADEAGS